MKFLKSFGGTLKDQYYAFRVLYWVDIVVAAGLALFSYHLAAMLLAILALLLGSISNDKKILIIVGQMRDNQERIEDKINVLLGD